MASTHDFFLSGDHEQSKQKVAEALTSLGFTLTSTPTGGFTAKRGSLGVTLLIGAWAGKNFHVTFIIEFFVDDKGQLVARLNRDVALGALKGGAIGAAKTNNAFIDTVNSVGTALNSAGVLAASVEIS